LLLGLAALATAASVAVVAQARRAGRDGALGSPEVPPATRIAAGGLDRASALLAAAALADSAVEHYRGSFHNKAMYVPLGVSALTLATRALDATGSLPGRPIQRGIVNGLAVATGIAGTGFLICDGSVFPTVGGVNPSLTIQAIACRTADRIRALAARGEL